MKIIDRVYGPINIDEPVLVELIKSKPLQRLKNINQAGASKYAIAGKTVSRFEHSLGVMILLKILGASLEEQIAGLLHDVPHTAFSHVIDFVFPSKEYKHEFHEKFHKQLVKNSEVPSILAKYNYDLDRILDEHNFSLLERDLPDLCADRIDYALRDRVAMNYDIGHIADYIKNFVVKDNEIIFKDKVIAYYFAQDYLEMDYRAWSHPKEIALFKVLANAIKIALDNTIISQEDLFSDDDFVYNKLKNSNHKDILHYLDKLNYQFAIKEDSKNYDFFARNKLRFVDPKFIDIDNKLSKVSTAFPKFKAELTKHKDWVETGHFIKIVN
ncbi:MAG: HD domain-containing protein [Patescibacteria group bacterium]|jgi:hypothetical protein